MITHARDSSKIVTIVLTVAFALLAGVIAFATWKGGSFELRSKAAYQEILLKQWTFDSGKEGWNGTDFASDTASNGSYVLTVRPTSTYTTKEYVCTGTKKRGNYRCRNKAVQHTYTPRIDNTSVNVPIKATAARLYLSLALNLNRPDASKIGMTKLPITVSYKLAGEPKYRPPLTISVNPYAKRGDLSVDFPKDVSLKTIEAIRISFDQYRTLPNAILTIGDIRLMGLNTQKPTESGEFKGTVTKEELSQGDVSSILYLLTAPGGIAAARNTVYQMVQAPPPPCPTGAMCKMMVPTPVNFEQYVGKNVVVTGYVQTAVRGEVSWRGETTERQAMYRGMPILYVTDIRLADGTGVSCGADGTSCTIGTCPQPVCEGDRACPAYYIACKLQAGVCKAGTCVANPEVLTTPPANCEYVNVECIQAPCEPLLRCTQGSLPPGQ